MGERTCTAEECESAPIARGWCGKHWQRWSRHGTTDLLTPPTPDVCTMDDCDDVPMGRGWCTRHYNRWYRTGDPYIPDAADRFWSKIDKNGPVIAARPDLGPCWLWTGGLHAAGYGAFRPSKKTPGAGSAHSWSFEQLVGPVPKGMTLDHLCHTFDLSCPGGRCEHRRCAAPLHLEIVTPGENARRGRGGARQAAKTHCPQNHEYAGRNLIVNKNGGRQCRTCVYAQHKVRRDLRRARRLAASQ